MVDLPEPMLPSTDTRKGLETAFLPDILVQIMLVKVKVDFVGMKE